MILGLEITWDDFMIVNVFPVVSGGLPYRQPTQSHGTGNFMRCHVVKTTMSMPPEEVKTWVFYLLLEKLKIKNNLKDFLSLS
jgi:hypothetical protein